MPSGSKEKNWQDPHFLYSSIVAARPRRFAVRPCAFLQIQPWMLNNSALHTPLSLRSAGKWQLEQWVVAMATRKGKSATSCIVRPVCLFALRSGADGFSHVIGEMVLYFFGSVYINIISYTICHILNGMMTPISESQIWEWRRERWKRKEKAGSNFLRLEGETERSLKVYSAFCTGMMTNFSSIIYF